MRIWISTLLPVMVRRREEEEEEERRRELGDGLIGQYD